MMEKKTIAIIILSVLLAISLIINLIGIAILGAFIIFSADTQVNYQQPQEVQVRVENPVRAVIKTCSNDDKEATVCAAEYNPVCGYPSDPRVFSSLYVGNTYSNSCEACRDAEISHYVDGECINLPREFVE